jgi:hypothetical protein
MGSLPPTNSNNEQANQMSEPRATTILWFVEAPERNFSGVVSCAVGVNGKYSYKKGND